GRPDGGKVEHDLGSAEASGLCLHVALVDAELNTQPLEPHQVKIHGTRADGAAAGCGDPRAAEARKQRTQDEEGCTHRLDELVGRLAAGDVAGLDDDLVSVGAPLGASPQVPEHLERGRHVGQHRDVLDHAAFAREQRREDERQRGVLRAAHRHFALERSATPDHDRVHQLLSPRRATSTRSMLAWSSTVRTSPYRPSRTTPHRPAAASPAPISTISQPPGTSTSGATVTSRCSTARPSGPASSARAGSWSRTSGNRPAWSPSAT